MSWLIYDLSSGCFFFVYYSDSFSDIGYIWDYTVCALKWSLCSVAKEDITLLPEVYEMTIQYWADLCDSKAFCTFDLYDMHVILKYSRPRYPPLDIQIKIPFHVFPSEESQLVCFMYRGSISSRLFNHTRIDFGQESKHHTSGDDLPPFHITWVCEYVIFFKCCFFFVFFFGLLLYSNSALSLHWKWSFLSQITNSALASEALTSTYV